MSRYADTDIRGAVVSRVGLLLLKHIFDPELAPRLVKILALMRDVIRQPGGLQALSLFLRYISGTIQNLDEIKSVLKNEQRSQP